MSWPCSQMSRSSCAQLTAATPTASWSSARACSTLEITNAVAPSQGTSQSNRLSGVEIMRAPR